MLTRQKPGNFLFKSKHTGAPSPTYSQIFFYEISCVHALSGLLEFLLAEGPHAESSKYTSGEISPRTVEIRNRTAAASLISLRCSRLAPVVHCVTSAIRGVVLHGCTQRGRACRLWGRVAHCVTPLMNFNLSTQYHFEMFDGRYLFGERNRNILL
jgi:hypothetical protein